MEYTFMITSENFFIQASNNHIIPIECTFIDVNCHFQRRGILVLKAGVFGKSPGILCARCTADEVTK